MSEEPSKKYPVKTTVGVGLLLLWLSHGRGGLGFGKDKGKQPLGYATLGNMPVDLRSLILFEDGVPTNTVQIILTPDGLSKLPQGPGQSVKLEEVTRHSAWFQRGKLRLVLKVRGDAREGDATELKAKLRNLNIEFWA